MGTYAFEEVSIGGSYVLDDEEINAHVLFYGTGTGYSILCADATTFTGLRMYRLTNHSDSDIEIYDGDDVLIDTLLAGNVLQLSLVDLSTVAGDWRAIQHMSGAAYIEA